MDSLEWIFGAFAVIFAAGFIIWDRRKTNKVMDTLEEMLHQAMSGSFDEKNFDESRLSKVEYEMANFLKSVSVSTQKMGEERDRMKTLISDISHQTKTPIANILLYSELLRDGGLSEEQESNVQAVYEQTEKLRFLIEQLIKLSRLENGILTLSPERAELFPVLQSVHSQLRKKAEEKGIELILESTEAEAVIDVKWTTEAVFNLVDNAVKYTKHGSVKMTAKIYELFTCIVIADTGMGIPEEEQPKIFSRFYRSQKVKEVDGVGIGLYLAREIVSKEGGYIKVDSREGEGAVFSVFLQR